MEKTLTELAEQVKAAHRIAPYVAPHTGGLRSSGPGFFVGRCPFHEADEKKPKSQQLKFWINANGGTCGCFVPGCPAYCNASEDPTTRPLDVINFYALLHNVSNEEAITEMAKELGLTTG